MFLVEILLIILYAVGCYYVAKRGAEKKLGFGDALLLSVFLTPIFGMVMVSLSTSKSTPEVYSRADYEHYKAHQKHELTAAEQKAYSALLKQYSKGQISKQEFENQSARF